MEEQGNGENTEEELLQWAAAELDQVQARIGPRFRHAEARLRAGRFLQALLAPVESKNGWQMAEELGEQGPRAVQRLLGEADWDEEVVCDDLRAYVIEHVGDNGGILVVDKTGFLKKGKKSAGSLGSTVGLPGGGRTARSASFCSMPAPKARRL
ncbi:hypothetical protein KSD_65600 [Ktedonobacter sp. SOSP1-85]|nr:hypothetical protein KSD_65600 [Ktedonobacter sp. SOSP1-85]